jgi:hypothetical protein
MGKEKEKGFLASWAGGGGGGWPSQARARAQPRGQAAHSAHQRGRRAREGVGEVARAGVEKVELGRSLL